MEVVAGVCLVLVARLASALRDVFFKAMVYDPASGVQRCLLRACIWLGILQVILDTAGAVLTPLVVIAPLAASKAVFAAIFRPMDLLLGHGSHGSPCRRGSHGSPCRRGVHSRRVGDRR
jgi:hypothetical protein